mgnify:CR=1 FL=1
MSPQGTDWHLVKYHWELPLAYDLWELVLPLLDWKVRRAHQAILNMGPIYPISRKVS